MGKDCLELHTLNSLYSIIRSKQLDCVLLLNVENGVILIRAIFSNEMWQIKIRIHILHDYQDTKMWYSHSVEHLAVRHAWSLVDISKIIHRLCSFNTVFLSCFLFTGKVSGAGYGLPCSWWADDRHPGAASLCLPLGSASGRVKPRLPDPGRAGRNGSGGAWCQGLRLFLHHDGAKSLPHRTVLLHDVCGRENVQTGEWWLFIVWSIILLFISSYVFPHV